MHDFEYAINNAKSLVDITKFDVQVQGIDCPKQIIECLNDDDFSKFDLIVITRGGGSMEDLWGFNDKKLIETIYKRNKPILAAIGHMIDTTLIDYVADISCPTPSLAAQYIIDYNRKYVESINNHKQELYNKLINNINKDLAKLEKLGNKKKEFKIFIENKLDRYKNIIIYEIKYNLLKLDKIKNQYNNNNIYIYKENENINYEQFKEIVNNKQPFSIIWNNTIINVINYQ